MPIPRSPVTLAPSPAFTVAEDRRAGLSASTLRSAAWSTPYRGMRVTHDHEDHERLGALLRALPASAFFCGPTSALLQGLPLPSSVASKAQKTPVVGVPNDHVRVRRPGTVGRRLLVDARDIVVVNGMRCTSPLRTWVELAASLSVPQLTAISDHLIFHRSPLASREELECIHRRFLGGRGSKARRLAIDLANDRAESPRETELRVLLVMAGLPEPECNVEIFHGQRFVARVDLLYRHARLIIEYDGDHHRDAIQWSRDQMRRAELESLGYRFTTVTARDFDDPTTLLARVRRLLAQGASA